MFIKDVISLATATCTLCFGGQNTLSHTPSFEDLMGSPTVTCSPQDLQDLREFSEDYQKKIQYLNEPHRGTIPKVIHFVWLGPKPFPSISIQNVISWKTHHPNWQFILWTDSKEREPPIPGMEIRLVQEYDFGSLQPLIESTNYWAEKSDMIRYMILYNEGGIYADHDMWCEKSVAPLVDAFDCVVGCDPQQQHPGIESAIITNNSTIMARPGHPILKKTIEGIVLGWDRATQQCPGKDPESSFMRTALRTLSPFVSAVKRYRNRKGNRDIILPAAYMYPHGVFSKDVFEKLRADGYVFAIHKHINN